MNIYSHFRGEIVAALETLSSAGNSRLASPRCAAPDPGAANALVDAKNNEQNATSGTRALKRWRLVRASASNALLLSRGAHG